MTIFKSEWGGERMTKFSIKKIKNNEWREKTTKKDIRCAVLELPTGMTEKLDLDGLYCVITMNCFHQ